MLDRESGKIVHIDFGDCFEVAQTREKYPEKIPFRLTRMLIMVSTNQTFPLIFSLSGNGNHWNRGKLPINMRKSIPSTKRKERFSIGCIGSICV